MPTHAIVENPFGDITVAVYERKVILTDDQIKALPTTPVVLIPATETLNYTDTPTKLIVPVAVFAVLDKLGGGYTNNDTSPYFLLAWGSDWSMDVSDHASVAGSYINQSGVIAYIPFSVPKTNGNINALNGSLQDNALVIAGNNGSLGNFTGGHPDNTLEVTVLYSIIDL